MYNACESEHLKSFVTIWMSTSICWYTVLTLMRKYPMIQSISHQVAKELVGKLIVVVSIVEVCRMEV